MNALSIREENILKVLPELEIAHTLAKLYFCRIVVIF